jgi:N6-adenosine-specific RNA methylase IME4/ParB-like chromosome segregation protein Spo0J
MTFSSKISAFENAIHEGQRETTPQEMLAEGEPAGISPSPGVVVLKISDIEIPYNRRNIDPAVVKGIAETMKIIGQIEPIIVVKKHNSTAGEPPYWGVDGEHRIKSCLLLGRETIECIVRDYATALERKYAEICANIVRSEVHFLDAGDQLNQWDVLLKESGVRANQSNKGKSTSAQSALVETTKSLAAKFGMKERTFQILKRIAKKLSAEAKQVIKELKLSRSDAAHLIKLDYAERDDILALADKATILLALRSRFPKKAASSPPEAKSAAPITMGGTGSLCLVPVAQPQVSTPEPGARTDMTDSGFLDRIRMATDLSDAEKKEIAKAAKKIFSEDWKKKRQEYIARLEDSAMQKIKEAEGVYDVIVIDPPWNLKYMQLKGRAGQVGLPYKTMTEEEISKVRIPAADDCHIWLWTTQKHLSVAKRLLKGWGFKYSRIHVWHKDGGPQPLDSPKYNCEFVLYARKGNPKFADTKDFPTCFYAKRTGHSKKPKKFYDIVRRVTAGRRLDMFNRRDIDGFDGWGLESPSNRAGGDIESPAAQ